MLDLHTLERLAKEYLASWNEQYSHPLRNYWGQRTVLQLQFAVKLSAVREHMHDRLIEEAIASAWSDFRENGAVTRETCLRVEDMLKPLGPAAKSMTLLCIGHAHIDMNWMWSYDETVSVTLDTLRTMLDLMKEYPGYTYAQSQAAVYEIVAKHDQAMLEEIRERVHEGRWEVTASTWVEADRNMPNAESMARHFLYTRKYLAGLLQIDPASLDLDYEPDTFGHHQNVPEILSDAGVKYYYHCRGADGPLLYRWQAPSGRSILGFREPLWYNWTMDGQCAMILPEFCHGQGMDVMLRVYGVGDHGGGPTRRDIEKIMDMDTWPIFPNYRFGTYHDFFRAAELRKEQLPIVQGEQNFIFDGCFTTQTRIKRGNRLGEAVLFEAEGVSALSSLLLDQTYPAADFEQAWKNVLFNQFHDILPGSGTVDTREYALGLYQQAYALANTRRMASLRAIADAIDTSSLQADDPQVFETLRFSRAEGAGTGFPTVSGGLGQTGRQAGLQRLFMVWNPLPVEREELCELTVWDWPGDASRMRFHDGNGAEVLHQVVTDSAKSYWGHLYQTVLVQVRVPAAGYQTLVLDEKPLQEFAVKGLGPQLQKESSFILENDLLCVSVSPLTGSIVSILDKETGEEMVAENTPTGIFRLLEEDPGRGMTAWVVGRYRKVLLLNRDIRTMKRQDGPLRQSLTWRTGFGNGSELAVTIGLEAGERQVHLDASVRWQEIGDAKTGILQLGLLLPLPYPCGDFRYDIPMGFIDRKSRDMDVPATSLAIAKNPSGRSIMLVSDSKYGYRGSSEGLSLTLIRSSFDPDPWPEIGDHHIRMAIVLTDGEPLAAGQTAQAFCHPFSVVSARSPHPGSLPLCNSLVTLVEGKAMLSGVKMAEDGGTLILRLYSVSGQPTNVRLRFWQAPSSAQVITLMEKSVGHRLPVLEDRDVCLTLKPFATRTLSVRF